VHISGLLRSLLSIAAAAMISVSASGQDYPLRPIRIIVGFGAGGSTDAIARYYAQKLSEVLKTTVIIDNKPGAKQMVAIRAIMGATPDGYTLYLGSGSSLSQAPGVDKDTAYDPLKDFTPIALVATVPGVIITSPNLSVRSVKDLVAYSQANPSKLNYGSSGIGSASHLQTEYLINLTGLKATHIPYKSDADIMREIAVGSIQMGLSPLQGAVAFISNGKVRAIAVTGSRRLKGLPNVPSLSESGFKGLGGIDPYTYYGLVGPPGLPQAVVSKLNEAVNKVSAAPGVVTQLQDMMFAEPGAGSAESFRNYMRDDVNKWRAFAKVVKISD
jgi:tripartite-type tricarboxylate transporter receptor subunit TctC